MTIRQIAKRTWLESTISIVFITIEVICQILIPTFMANLIDQGIQSQNQLEIYKWSGLIFLFAIMSLICGAISGVFASKASGMLARDLRYELFQKIQNFSFGNIDKFSTGSLIIRLTNDITNIRMAYMNIIRTMIRGPIMLVGAVILGFINSTKLAWILLVALVIMGTVFTVIFWIVYPKFKKSLEVMDQFNSKVQENLSAIKTIKSFNKEKHEFTNFEKFTLKLRDILMRNDKTIAWGQFTFLGLIFLSSLLISYLTTQNIVSTHGSGDLTIGILTSFVSYLWQVMISLMMIVMVAASIIFARAGAARIAEVLSEESTIQNVANPIKELKNFDIKYENVFLKYHENDENYTLKNINLEIKEGQTIGIVGSTGSGKSSLIQLLPRLYDISKGKLTIGGIEVKDYDLEFLRDNVSMVLQKNVLFSGTLRENMQWGDPNVTDDEIEKALRISSAHDFVFSKEEGLDQHVAQKGNNYSGGQKQRLCIARALIKKPKILIMDDSTSAVDTKTDKQIRMALRNNLPNTTKIIIAHRISSIETADKIIVMKKGEISGFGTHQELLENNEFYAGLYNSQNGGK